MKSESVDIKEEAGGCDEVIMRCMEVNRCIAPSQYINRISQILVIVDTVYPDFTKSNITVIYLAEFNCF